MKRKAFLLLSVVMVMSMALSACTPAATSQPTAAPAEATAPAAATSAPAAGSMTVRVATEATYPPFEVVDEKTKELDGFDIDLMKAIAANQGLTVDFINTPFDSVLSGVATCQFDAAISAMTITEDRKQKMSFSDPYVDAGQIVTVAASNTDINSVSDLKGKRIAVQLGTTGEIEAKKIEGATVKPFDTADLAFLELTNNQVDAVIVDNPTTFVYTTRFKDKIKTVGKPFTDEQYGIAVCKTNTELLAKLNAGLAAVKADGTVQKLQDKWLSAQ